ncbi:MAG: carbohydrate ABC transporter permease [Spirochaetaceae bacterium]|nr:carbohydrate ABC transporter permease [Spirochaetaceae bacterium]RKX81382.1 MAG: ABC transporter permease [Spirochaetota bacterium]RKX85840.1 MAG: ABC transporter permease [Spirochaetota bacterium]RKX97037.1 MAG: ABC transporter permease [Spirochaetota bacterium]
MIQTRFQTIRLHTLLILAVLIICLPVILAIIISTQSEAQVLSYPPRLIPGSSTIDNYNKAWRTVNLGRLMFNSGVIAISVTIGKVILSLLSAFAFTHFEFKGKQFFFFLILVTLLLPVPVRIVALFDVVRGFGWIDSYAGLIIPFWASATGTFLFIQRFKTVPVELIDASRMDGCRPMQYFFRILLPLTKSTIGALCVIEFIYIWNQYLWPLMATNSDSMRVVQIGIKMLMNSESSNNWGVIMAGVVISMLPPLLLFFVLQDSFMKGFALQSEK